jgi:UrcA family protein
MKTQSIIRSALVAIVAAGTIVATPVMAADGAPEAHIRVGSFNLSNVDDQKVLVHKIRVSAAQVCPGINSNDLNERLEARRCFKAAVKSGNEQLASFKAHDGTAFAQLDLKVSGAPSK